jgi:hypothetical protein
VSRKPRQELEVDLVDDAGVRRHDLEVAEGVLAPLEEGIAFLVAGELDGGVALEGIGRAVVIDLHGVIDDELRRRQRVDRVGLATELYDRVAHGREVDHRRDAGEVLEHHAGRREGDLVLGLAARLPAREGLDVRRADVAAVGVAEQVLEQDLERVGQAGDVPGGHAGERVVRVLVAVDSEGGGPLGTVRHRLVSAIGVGDGGAVAGSREL